MWCEPNGTEPNGNDIKKNKNERTVSKSHHHRRHSVKCFVLFYLNELIQWEYMGAIVFFMYARYRSIFASYRTCYMKKKNGNFVVHHFVSARAFLLHSPRRYLSNKNKCMCVCVFDCLTVFSFRKHLQTHTLITSTKVHKFSFKCCILNKKATYPQWPLPHFATLYMRNLYINMHTKIHFRRQKLKLKNFIIKKNHFSNIKTTDVNRWN